MARTRTTQKTNCPERQNDEDLVFVIPTRPGWCERCTAHHLIALTVSCYGNIQCGPSGSPGSFVLNRPTYAYDDTRDSIPSGCPGSFAPIHQTYDNAQELSGRLLAAFHPSNSESHEEYRAPLSETSRISIPDTDSDSNKPPKHTQPSKTRIIHGYKVDGESLNKAQLQLLNSSRIYNVNDGLQMFKCKGCAKSNAMRLPDFGRHLLSKVHCGDSLRLCSECNKTFTRKDSLKRHQLKYHPHFPPQ